LHRATRRCVVEQEPGELGLFQRQQVVAREAVDRDRELVSSRAAEQELLPIGAGDEGEGLARRRGQDLAPVPDSDVRHVERRLVARAVVAEHLFEHGVAERVEVGRDVRPVVGVARRRTRWRLILPSQKG
jgi:hypothetical protein